MDSRRSRDPEPSRDDERRALSGIDFARMPRHVGIIMDGNGRWAKQRGLPRVAGHRAGIAAVRDVVDGSVRLGLEVLTLYAFSRENWSRPAAEVNALMLLLRDYLEQELPSLHERNIRMRAIGRTFDLAPAVQRALGDAETLTAANTGMTFLVALSYSGRGEIAAAARSLARAAMKGEIAPDEIDEDAIARHLDTAGLPDPDLLVRTSGEMRVSNFLLWQIAYAELWITPVLWPDFRRQHLYGAVADFQRRERRFGNVNGPGALRRTAAAVRRRLLP
jgi:undecaprenyl diphosphate synthase